MITGDPRQPKPPSSAKRFRGHVFVLGQRSNSAEAVTRTEARSRSHHRGRGLRPGLAAGRHHRAQRRGRAHRPASTWSRRRVGTASRRPSRTAGARLHRSRCPEAVVEGGGPRSTPSGAVFTASMPDSGRAAARCSGRRHLSEEVESPAVRPGRARCGPTCSHRWWHSQAARCPPAPARHPRRLRSKAAASLTSR